MRETERIFTTEWGKVTVDMPVMDPQGYIQVMIPRRETVDLPIASCDRPCQNSPISDHHVITVEHWDGRLGGEIVYPACNILRQRSNAGSIPMCEIEAKRTGVVGQVDSFLREKKIIAPATPYPIRGGSIVSQLWRAFKK